MIFNNGIEESEVLANAALAINTLPGDYNRDGNVGAADYVVWRDSNGACGPITRYGEAILARQLCEKAIPQ